MEKTNISVHSIYCVLYNFLKFSGDKITLKKPLGDGKILEVISYAAEVPGTIHSTVKFSFSSLEINAQCLNVFRSRGKM